MGDLSDIQQQLVRQRSSDGDRDVVLGAPDPRPLGGASDLEDSVVELVERFTVGDRGRPAVDDREMAPPSASSSASTMMRLSTRSARRRSLVQGSAISARRQPNGL
jgi:hypothetical protein